MDLEGASFPDLVYLADEGDEEEQEAATDELHDRGYTVEQARYLVETA